MSHILDDFFSQSQSECRGYLLKFQTIADFAGIPVKHSNNNISNNNNNNNNFTFI